MKRKFFIEVGILIVLILLVLIGVAHAASVSSSKVFGGKIISTKATEIETLESANYSCVVAGETIQINPIKGPSSYIIPAGTISKTGYKTRTGQWIIGKYSGKTTITCTFQGEPPATETVTLDTITLYGTSK